MSIRLFGLVMALLIIGSCNQRSICNDGMNAFLTKVMPKADPNFNIRSSDYILNPEPMGLGLVVPDDSVNFFQKYADAETVYQEFVTCVAENLQANTTEQAKYVLSIPLILEDKMYFFYLYDGKTQYLIEAEKVNKEWTILNKRITGR